MEETTAPPAFPPGFWRRIVIDPSPGSLARGSGLIVAALEDDAHRLTLAISHADGRVTAVDARTERVPYSTCPGAAEAIASALTGLSLDDLTQVNPREQCTHLYDLAIAAIAHAHEAQPTRCCSPGRSTEP